MSSPQRRQDQSARIQLRMRRHKTATALMPWFLLPARVITVIEGTGEITRFIAQKNDEAAEFVEDFQTATRNAAVMAVQAADILLSELDRTEPQKGQTP